MVILNCGNNFSIKGGSDKIFFEHANILRNRGHEIVPFAPDDGQDGRSSVWSDYFPSAINADNPKISELPKFFFNWDTFKKLDALLKRKDFDLAHLHIYYGRLTGAILPVLKRNKIPVIQTLHDFKLISPNNNLICNQKICEECAGNTFWKAITNKCNKNSLAKSFAVTVESYLSRLLGAMDNIDHFVAPSDFLNRKMVENGVPEEKITTIYNPINCEEYSPNYKPGKYILYFGRLEQIKGVDTLLEAVNSLNLNLKIVGSGSDEQRLKKFTSQNTNVEFLGFQSGKILHNLINNSICTICPSKGYDIFPTTILESYACGKPVIGSNIGGIPEMIDHGKTGYLFEPGNSEELSAYINMMNQDKDKVTQMGINARDKVLSEFNTENYYKRIMKLYKVCLNRKRT